MKPIAGRRYWKKNPVTGSTFWPILDPGQRERGFRKGRVKEAELQRPFLFSAPVKKGTFRFSGFRPLPRGALLQVDLFKLARQEWKMGMSPFSSAVVRHRAHDNSPENARFGVLGALGVLVVRFLKGNHQVAKNTKITKDQHLQSEIRNPQSAISSSVAQHRSMSH